MKYLSKYVHKGEDFVRARIQGVMCEIEQYGGTRYISAAEATWRLLGYQMVDRYPAVTKIHARLEGEQYVTFPQDATPEERLQISDASPSKLTIYFNHPTQDCFTLLTILDYYEQYTIKKSKRNEPPPVQAPLGQYLDGYGKVISRSCLLYTSPSPRDRQKSRMPSSA